MVLVMLYLYGGWAPSAGVVALRREVRMEDCDFVNLIVLEMLEICKRKLGQNPADVGEGD